MVRSLIINTPGLTQEPFISSLEAVLTLERRVGIDGEYFRRSEVTRDTRRFRTKAIGADPRTPVREHPLLTACEVTLEYTFGNGCTLELILDCADNPDSTIKTVRFTYANLAAVYASTFFGEQGKPGVGFEVVATCVAIVELLLNGFPDQEGCPYGGCVDWLLPVVFTAGVPSSGELTLAENIPLPWLLDYLEKVASARSLDMLNARMVFVQAPEHPENHEVEGRQSQEIIAAHS